MFLILCETLIHSWNNPCLVLETTGSEGFRQSHLTATEENAIRHGYLGYMVEEEEENKMCRMCSGVRQEMLDVEEVEISRMCRMYSGIRQKRQEEEVEKGQVGDTLSCCNLNPKGSQENGTLVVAQLKACVDDMDMQRGIKLHADVMRSGLLESNIFVGNTLVTMYAKCGSMPKAQEVFDHLPAWNVVSWNALISGHANQGHVDEALACFEQMQAEGFSPNSVTFVCILRACAIKGAADKGEIMHAQIIRDKVLERDVAIGAALVDMYVKCGLLEKAQEVCAGLCTRDLVAWNVLLAGYTQHARDQEALIFFEHMRRERVNPDAITFTCALRACANMRACDKGQNLHSDLIKEGHLGKEDVALGTALVDMYAKCGRLNRALEVFDELPVWNVVSWNALITGYTQHGLSEEVLKCFHRMLSEGFCPDAVTYVSVLNAYGSMRDADKGQEIHAELVKEGLVERDIVIANSLIDMYVKSGLLDEAREVLDELPSRNVVTWNTLLGGYVQHGCAMEGGDCLKLIRQDGLSPDSLTFVCISKAYGNMSVLERGQEMHAEIVKEGLLERDMLVANGLVNMHANCGNIEGARQVFESLQGRDVVSWNAVIGGYAQLGKADMVYYSLGKMIREGIKPDPITFTLVLNTCSHNGILDEGQFCFEAISTMYGIFPTPEHHTCMVDLFGRAGLLEKAMAMIREAPCSSQFMMCHALLGACRKWEDKRLGSFASKHLAQWVAMDVAAYVCMSDL